MTDKTEKRTVLSMFNQILYPFTCPHCGHVENVVISRLDNVTDWPCGECARTTNLQTEPHTSAIADRRDTASEIDNQELQRGKNVERRD